MKLKLAKTYDSCMAGEPKLTVVLIHGIASDSSTYDKALAYFRNDHDLDEVRFVTFDLLGSGKSLKSDELEYNYREQVVALHNAISELGVKTPLILVGHSLGTFIVTKYASEYKKEISRLILVSPPVYTERDFDNPAFSLGIEAFKKAIGMKNPQIVEEKAFLNSMSKIVLRRDNYKRLAELDVPTVLIYSGEDQLIAPHNIPAMVEKNKKMRARKTVGRHGVSEDKYIEITKVLKEVLDAEAI